jgi:hypothetical protein
LYNRLTISKINEASAGDDDQALKNVRRPARVRTAVHFKDVAV